MIERLPAEFTTLEVRHEANEQVDKRLRYRQIKEVLGTSVMSAKEIANELFLKGYTPTNERNFVSPRITELMYQGIIENVGKKKCEWTGKTVSVFKIREE